MGLFDEAKRESDVKKQKKEEEETARKEKAAADLVAFQTMHEVEFNRIRQLLNDTAVEINQAGHTANFAEQNKLGYVFSCKLDIALQVPSEPQQSKWRKLGFEVSVGMNKPIDLRADSQQHFGKPVTIPTIASAAYFDQLQKELKQFLLNALDGHRS